MKRKPNSPKSAEGLKAWWAKMTPEQRTERARKAGLARASKMSKAEMREHALRMRAGHINS